jgi:hypothetical protein
MFVRLHHHHRAACVSHRAALHECRWLLVTLGVSMSSVTGVLLSIQLGPGLFLEDVHTRTPALFAAAAIALLAQGAAIAVAYRDELTRQRRRLGADAIAELCRQCGVNVVFDLPRHRARRRVFAGR